MSPNLNRKIFIVDCEYLFETSNIPNYKAMKLYSYHTQIGDKPILINHEYQLTGTHDVLYLIREYRHTPFPSGDILDDYRTVLIGKQFEIFDDAWVMPNEVAVCRPDYSIYEYDKPSLYIHASFVQFMNNNVILKNKQEWRRANSKATVIVDPNFWNAPAQVIVKCLEEIIFDKNIVFLYPIRLKKLLDEEVFNVFSRLKLAKFYKIRYNNNIGEDYNSIVLVIDVMKRLKTKHPYLNLGSIPVKIITKDHWESKANIYYDFERSLKIMNYAQKKKVRINFRYPSIRLASPSWSYFEFLKTWSNHYHTLSYIEALTKGACDFFGKGLVEIINNQRYWNSVKVKQAIHLIGNFTELIKEYGFTGWGGIYLSSADFIDFEYVKEKGSENRIL